MDGDNREIVQDSHLLSLASPHVVLTLFVLIDVAAGVLLERRRGLGFSDTDNDVGRQPALEVSSRAPVWVWVDECGCVGECGRS